MKSELEIRITVPDDEDEDYLNAVINTAIDGFLRIRQDSPDSPKTGRVCIEEAVVWWCLRQVP